MQSRTRRAALLIQVFIGLWVLCTARDALALPAVAGMCDPTAASAPAPLPVLPIRGGDILPLDDCDRYLAGFGEEEQPADSASIQVHEDAPKALPGHFELLELPGQMTPVPVAEQSPAISTSTDGIYRPPRG